MGDRYDRSKGTAGIKGINFQLDLLSIFLLNALRLRMKNWKLSTEHKLAGKFDDVVLETDEGVILLQAKYKENRKVTLERLLSTNSRNDDFSIPKYFLSYLDINSKFSVKNIIICTNAEAESSIFKYLIQNKVSDESVLYHREGALVYSFSDRLVTDLLANAKIYRENNSMSKGIDVAMITEENAKKFLCRLQFHVEYSSGSDLQKSIGHLLSISNSFNNLLSAISSRDLHHKIKEWFEQPKGESLTESRANAMFCEIQSDNYCNWLENHKIYFKNMNFNIVNPETRIYHIIADEGHLLYLMKVYRDLQHITTKTLYSSSEYDRDTQEEVIRAFNLPQYTFLIIASPPFSDEFTINKICGQLINLLINRDYKKIIFVAEHNNKLVQGMKSTGIPYDVLDELLTLEDLVEDSQKLLLKKESITFGRSNVSLGKLLPKPIPLRYKQMINSKILEKLVTDEKFMVDLKFGDEGTQEELQYYINRTFEGSVKHLLPTNDGSDDDEREAFNKMYLIPEIISEENIYDVGEDVEEEDNKKIFHEKFIWRHEKISEENIYDVHNKIILIADSAGMGKTTVVKSLAARMRKNYSGLYVFRIELNQCTKILKDYQLYNKSINILQLLKCNSSFQFTNELEKVLFSLIEMVVMLDGIDEISPDYTEPILDLLLQCQRAANVKKVFLTTRPHMARKLEKHLNVTPFTLVPLTKEDQIDFFTKHWIDSFKLEGGSLYKCKRYAETLIRNMSSWIKGWDSSAELTASPLHLKIISEVFSSNTGSEEWEGIEEYLISDDEEPKWPAKMNIAKLYKMFIEKKRDIFVKRVNQNGNMIATRAFTKQFDECLDYHRALALKTILPENELNFFSCFKNNNICDDQSTALEMGIIQKLNNQLIFVHRTFAEYFVAESIIRELEIQNTHISFQTFFIDNILARSEFLTIRGYLDNLLRDHLQSISTDMFKSYISLVKNTDNIDLIHQLAQEGHNEIIRLVLKIIDFKIIRNKSVSMFSFRFEFDNGHFKNTLRALKYITKLGGLNIQYFKGIVPLHMAVKGGHSDTVKLLLDMGADVNFKTNIRSSSNIGGETALHFAAGYGWQTIVELLVKYGADINLTNKMGYTALHFAIERGSHDTIAFLIAQGANLSIADKEGNSMLHWAVHSVEFDVIEYLIDRGLDINITNKLGYTVMHSAVRFADFGMVEFLQNRGADINIKTDGGHTPLHVAVMLPKREWLRKLSTNWWFVDYTDTDNDENLKIVQFLLKRSKNINVTDNEGNTALHFAVDGGSIKIIEALINYGADVNTLNNKRNTALHLDTSVGNFHIVKLLIQHGADVTIANEEGNTALHLATETKNCDIIRILIGHKFMLKFKQNKKGQMPFEMLSKDKNNMKLYKFLFDDKVNFKYISGKTWERLKLLRETETETD